MNGLKRIRGAIGMGVTWAVGWAIAGVLTGVASILLPGLPRHVVFAVFDAPLPALAIPGFFAGVFFSIVLGIAGRRRRLGELSLPRFAAWGAVSGLLLTLFPFALEVAGFLSRDGSDVGRWQTLAVLAGPFVVLSAISASVILMLARIADRRASQAVSAATADVALTEGEARARLAGGSSSLDAHRATRPGEPVRPDPGNGRSDA